MTKPERESESDPTLSKEDAIYIQGKLKAAWEAAIDIAQKVNDGMPTRSLAKQLQSFVTLWQDVSYVCARVENLAADVGIERRGRKHYWERAIIACMARGIDPFEIDEKIPEAKRRLLLEKGEETRRKRGLSE